MSNSSDEENARNVGGMDFGQNLKRNIEKTPEKQRLLQQNRITPDKKKLKERSVTPSKNDSNEDQIQDVFSDDDQPIMFKDIAPPSVDKLLGTNVPEKVEMTRSVVSRNLNLDQEGSVSPDRLIDLTVDELDNIEEEIEKKDFSVEGSPVFSNELLKPEKVMEILGGFSSELDDRRICWKLPPVCPAKGEFCFVLKLGIIPTEDLAYDEHGSWGKSRGHTYFFKVEEDKIAKVGGRDQKPKGSGKWDISLHVIQYSHPDSPFEFKKQIYRAKTEAGENCSWAVIQYEAEQDPSSIYNRKPHGNTKKSSEAFQRVRPSTRDMLLKQSMHSAPKKSMGIVTKKLGGGAALPTELPRNSGQARNIAKKNPSSFRSNSAGRPVQQDFSVLERMMGNPGSFVVAQNVTAPRSEGESQHVQYFLTDPRSISLLKNFGLKTSEEKRPLKVDMTYGCVQGFYLTPVQIRHPFFQHKDTGREPIIPVGFMLSNYRGRDEYEFLARSLVKYAPKGSDGEAALIEGFCTQPQFKEATHLRCELHLRENIERQLHKCTYKEVAKYILNEIFGTENVQEGEYRQRKAGLVDANSVEEFMHRLNGKQAEWEKKAPGFHAWLIKEKQKVLCDCYLLPKRLEIGTYGRVTNNDSERLNGLIKNEIAWIVQPVQTAVGKLERFVNAIFENLQFAVIRRHDWRLKGKWSRKEIQPMQWLNKTEAQKAEYWKSMGLGLEIPIGSERKLTFPLAEAEISFLSMLDVGRIERKAEQILAVGGETFTMNPSGEQMVSVWDGDQIFKIEGRPRTGLKCSCPDFRHYRRICGHVVAFADHQNELFPFISYVNTLLEEEPSHSGLKTSKNPAAGMKPGSRRRGSAASAGSHAMAAVDVPMQPPDFGLVTSFPSPEVLRQIQSPKRRIETETKEKPHWNQLSFWIGKGKPKKDTCKSCGSPFLSDDDPGNIPPADLYLRHSEKWVYTDRNKNQQVLSDRRTDYFYCMKFKCIMKRFSSYFYTGYLRIDRYTMAMLSGDVRYNQEVARQFGIELKDVTVE